MINHQRHCGECIPHQNLWLFMLAELLEIEINGPVNPVLSMFCYGRVCVVLLLPGVIGGFFVSLQLPPLVISWVFFSSGHILLPRSPRARSHDCTLGGRNTAPARSVPQTRRGSYTIRYNLRRTR